MPKDIEKFTLKQLRADFEADFKKRYKGANILKTSFHFLNWCANYDADSTEFLTHRFKAWCKRTECKSSLENALYWYRKVYSK